MHTYIYIYKTDEASVKKAKYFTKYVFLKFFALYNTSLNGFQDFYK